MKKVFASFVVFFLVFFVSGNVSYAEDGIPVKGIIKTIETASKATAKTVAKTGKTAVKAGTKAGETAAKAASTTAKAGTTAAVSSKAAKYVGGAAGAAGAAGASVAAAAAVGSSNSSGYNSNYSSTNSSNYNGNSSYNSGNSSGYTSPNSSFVSLANSSVTLVKGETYYLYTSVYNPNNESWYVNSTDESVVKWKWDSSANAIKLTAVSNGYASILTRIGDSFDECEVYVIADMVAPTICKDIKAVESKVSYVYSYNNERLSFQFKKDNLFDVGVTQYYDVYLDNPNNRDWYIASSDPDVATVEWDYIYGRLVVKPHKPGMFHIYAALNNSDWNGDSYIWGTVQGLSFRDDNDIQLISGEKYTFSVNNYPDNLYYTMSSSNPAVASVSGGTVTANGAGTATITIQSYDGKYSDKRIISVYSIPKTVTLNLGDKKKIVNLPSTMDVKFTSGYGYGTNEKHTSVISVDDNGIVTAQCIGTSSVQVSHCNYYTTVDVEVVGEYYDLSVRGTDGAIDVAVSNSVGKTVNLKKGYYLDAVNVRIECPKNSKLTISSPNHKKVELKPSESNITILLVPSNFTFMPTYYSFANGEAKGIVVNSQGRAVSGAKVTYKDAFNNKYTAISDSNGLFSMSTPNIRRVIYSSAKAKGYKPLTYKGVVWDHRFLVLYSK